ncbi:Zinc finger CCHC domain-containing protein 7 [Sparganum proliferum]
MLRPLSVGVGHRPEATIRRLLMQPKDRLPPADTSGVIYRVNCLDCLANYCGMTDKRLRTRVHEHALAVKRKDVRSHVAMHSLENNHVFDFGGAQVLGRAESKLAREVIEAWQSDANSINRSKMNLEENYDSDTIDEDLEANLYSSVYFDNTVEEPSEAAPQTTNHLVAEQDSPRTESLFENVTSTPMLPRETFIDSPASIFPESFTWSFPPELESTVTSLSLVADAIYLNLTGELPPSVKQSFAQKCGRTLADSLSIASPSTPLSLSKRINGSTFDTNHSPLQLKRVSFEVASSSDEDSDEEDYSQFDPNSSDIILGVSNMSKHGFVTSNDDVTEISRILKRSRSEPAFWQLDRDDLRHTQFRNNRYYDDTRTCSICFKKGHNARECSRTGPVCILCGVDGHFSSSCPAQYCSSCLTPGHTQANCTLLGRLRSSTCKLCRQVGHCEDTCGGIMQRFRLADKNRDPLKGFKPPKSCCFCGRRGHVFEECRSRPNHRGPLALATSSRRDRQKGALTRFASCVVASAKRRDSLLYRGGRAGSLDADAGVAALAPRSDTKTRKRLEKAANRVERKLFEKALKQARKQERKALKAETAAFSNHRGASSTRGKPTINRLPETPHRNSTTSLFSTPAFSPSFVAFSSDGGPSAKRARKSSSRTRTPVSQVNGFCKKNKKKAAMTSSPYASTKPRPNTSNSGLNDRNPLFNPNWTFEESGGPPHGRSLAASEAQTVPQVSRAVEEEEWYRKTVRPRRIPSWGGGGGSSPSPRGGRRQRRRGWAASGSRRRTDHAMAAGAL